MHKSKCIVQRLYIRQARRFAHNRYPLLYLYVDNAVRLCAAHQCYRRRYQYHTVLRTVLRSDTECSAPAALIPKSGAAIHSSHSSPPAARRKCHRSQDPRKFHRTFRFLGNVCYHRRRRTFRIPGNGDRCADIRCHILHY